MGRLDAPLIGREKETAYIEQAIEETLRGRRRAIKLVGEAGMGKTSLLKWAQERSDDLGLLSISVRSVATGALPAGHLIGEMLRLLNDELQTGVSLVEAPQSDLASTVHGPPSLLSLLDALTMATRSRVLGIFLDDLQWAHREDVSTLFAALMILERPSFLTVTERTPRTMSQSTPADNVTAEFPMTRSEIRGLDIHAVGVLSARILGAPVLPSLARELHARTLGNPLFVDETLRAWQSADVITFLSGDFWSFRLTGAKPDATSLVDMIAARVARLGPQAFELTTVLALVDRPCFLRELEGICNLDEEEAVSVVTSLDEQGLVKRHDTGAYELAHPLYQSAMSAELSPTHRAQLHEAIYRVLVDQGSLSASELAFHAQRALTRPGGIDELLLAAAHEAERNGSNSDAAAWYEGLARVTVDKNLLITALEGQAENVARFDPKLAVQLFSRAIQLTDPGNRKGRLLLGRAKAARGAGRSNEALSDLELATTMARSGDSLDIVDAALVTRVAMGDTSEAEARWLELAKATVGTPVHGKVLGHLAMVPYVSGRILEAKAKCEAALREELNPFDRRNICVNLSWFLTLLGLWSEAQNLTEGLLAEAEKARDLWALIPVTNTAAHLAAWKGDVERALDLGAQGLAITNYHLSDPGDRLTSLAAYATGLFEIGLMREVVELLAQTPSVADALDEKVEVLLAFCLLAEAHALLGNNTQAIRIAEDARKYLAFNRSCEISVDRVDAHIAFLGGDARGALARLSPWLDEPSEVAFEQARTFELAASIHLSSGNKQEAFGAGEAAIRVYGDLGAKLRMERMSNWMDSAKSGRRGRPRSRLAGDLTPREHQILKLVAAGQTNPEIARCLFISPATVKKHIENVKLRTGIRTRAGLVAFLRDLPTEVIAPG